MINYGGNNAAMQLCVNEYNKRLNVLAKQDLSQQQRIGTILTLLFATLNALISIISKYDPEQNDLGRDMEWFKHHGRQSFLNECQILSGIVLEIEQPDRFNPRLLSPDDRQRFIKVKQYLQHNIPEAIKLIPDYRMAPAPAPNLPPQPDPGTYHKKKGLCERCLRALHLM
ncbi:MAG: hypothetical protein K2Q14_02900 [Gammaproteobacteria bacterium]|nr:hypothetical protein [Gammaproteobacteria bacterium]